jgi:hypothetical protein
MLRATSLLVFAFLAACATTTATHSTLAPRYFGVWVNVNPSDNNWWQIGPAGVVNYGVALDDGKCTGRAATVLAANRLNINFGNSATVYLRLAEGDLLLFEAGPAQFSLQRRGQATDICRRPDGTYFDGAPDILR